MPLNLPPTSADVRARIPPLTFQRLGFPPPTPPAVDPLDSFCETAAAYVAATTGRQIDSTLTVQAPPPQVLDWINGFGDTSYGSELDLGPIGFRAVILRVVQEALHEAASYTRAVVGQDFLESFKAGSYAEKRRDSQTILHSRGSVSNPTINEWRELSDLLWLLCTGRQFDYWMMRLGSPPAASIMVEGDFRDTWDAPGGMSNLPGFGAPGMAGDWPGGVESGWSG